MAPCHWFIFKAVSRCNLACKYCYMYFRGDESYRERSVFVSPEVVDAFALRLKNYQQRHQLPRVHVSFHGGEPLMLGVQRFREYAQRLAEACGPSLTLSVQTNGLLLNEEWLETLAECDVSIGISIDGPAAVNDRHRIDHGGRSSFAQTRAAIDLVRTAAEQKRVKFGGLISVIDPDQDPREFYAFMTRDLGARIFNVLLPDANHDNYARYVAHPVSKFSEFLTGLFDAWWRDDPARITIPFFLSLVRKIMLDTTHSESIGAFAAPSIVVETDGSIQAHDVLRMNTPGHAYAANVLTDEIDALFGDAVYENVTRPPEPEHVAPLCSRCPVFHICQGGFVAHRYASANGYANPSVYCTALFDVVTRVYFSILNEESRATA